MYINEFKKCQKLMLFAFSSRVLFIHFKSTKYAMTSESILQYQKVRQEVRCDVKRYAIT